MRVAYCFTFASTIYQSLVLENRRENGERMESDSDYKSESVRVAKNCSEGWTLSLTETPRETPGPVTGQQG